HLSTWKIASSFRGIEIRDSAFSITVGEDQVISVIFMSQGLANDNYQGFIKAQYNAGEGQTLIPVNFIVDIYEDYKHENQTGSIPESYWLGTPYPNPFNSTTIIRFALPLESKVKLMVYDILGREVKMLADERFRAGTHGVSFDSSNLSSGIYFVIFKAGDTRITKKMVHLK
ncbi:MAG: T9SS type A sorting domain-containing protein, partial [Candidatus Electryonea clarkiae]|nr:T9SS type A sorting domain-containing protein [Candidatus Electryonea clarkiae]